METFASGQFQMSTVIQIQWIFMRSKYDRMQFEAVTALHPIYLTIQIVSKVDHNVFASHREARGCCVGVAS